MPEPHRSPVLTAIGQQNCRWMKFILFLVFLRKLIRTNYAKWDSIGSVLFSPGMPHGTMHHSPDNLIGND